MPKNRRPDGTRALRKAPTGIAGLDEITEGGLPHGRPTLVCGGVGCGKTVFGVQFLAHGATRFGERGVLVSFEETVDELVENARSVGVDLKRMRAQRQVMIDHVHIERSEIIQMGEYDLEGLFVRLGHAIDAIGAKRVVLDTVDMLFAGLENAAILRAELRRLFAWLKDRGVTAVITGERGAAGLTRHGLEEYVSDCVILLDHRVIDQHATRRLRIVKYRGSRHGTDEFPFVLNDTGLAVLPITGIGQQDRVSSQRISTGIVGLDEMLGGKGYYQGSSVLITGTAGTGKSTLAAAFAAAVCRRGERCLYFAFEETAGAIVRNMRSVGNDLGGWIKRKRLRIEGVRATAYGLESHLTVMHRLVEEFQPSAVVLDPISNLISVGTHADVKAMLSRLMDYLKARGITIVCTSLTIGGSSPEQTDVGISSLMDTWLLLQNREINRERNRGIQIVKSRGMAHSNQQREFRLGSRGVEFVAVHRDEEGRATVGSERAAQEGGKRQRGGKG